MTGIPTILYRKLKIRDDEKMINKKYRIFRLLFLMILFCMLIPIAASVHTTVTTTTYYEDFNDESDNAVPSSTALEGSWYTYANNSWGTGGYAKVNRTVDASHPFYINASKTPPALGWANFSFATAYAYDSFSYYFKYENTYTSKWNHSAVNIFLRGNSADICNISIHGSNFTIAGQRNRLLVKNYSGTIKANWSIMANKQYLVTYTPNWDNNSLKVVVYNTSSSTNLGTIWVTLQSQTTLNKWYMNNADSKLVNIRIDNLVLVKTVTTTQSSASYQSENLVENVLPLVLAAAIFVVVIGMILAGANTIEAWLTLFITVLLAVIVLGVIIGL